MSELPHQQKHVDGRDGKVSSDALQLARLISLKALLHKDGLDYQSLTPRRDPLYPNSKLITTPKPQLVSLPKIRSMPSLRESNSNSIDPKQSEEFHHTGQRLCSPASTISSRRSVSGMKHLLPLKLQLSPPSPNVDLFSRLDNKLQPDTTRLHLKQGSQDPSYIPWMLSPQDLQIPPHIHPRKYRETPIYSEPGSLMLARAYLSAESSCCNCPITGPCDELCIVSDYEDDDTHDSSSHASFADCAKGFNDISVKSSLTSYTSPRLSKLSIQCRGDQIIKDRLPSFSFDLRSPLGNCIEEMDNVSDENGNHFRGYALEGWIDSDSSRSSSPSMDDDVFDAFVTKLAPTKATVVEFIKSPQISSEHFVQPTSPWQSRPSTPLSFRGKIKELSMAPNRAQRQTLFGDDKTAATSQESARISFVSEHYRDFKNTLRHTHLNKLTAQSHTYRNGTISLPPQTSRFSKKESRDNIVDAIRRAVRGFPQNMLFLDTPCVVQIRRHSHPSYRLAPLPRSFSNHSEESPKYRPPSTKSQNSSFRRRTVAAAIFASVKRQHSTKDASLECDPSPATSAIKPPPYILMASRRVSELEDISSPDLTSFRKIFPSTGDWWRGVLYAHVVAYNYVQDTKMQSISNIPHKIYRMLGIPRCTSSEACPSEQQDPILADLESGLASCINRIIKCMVGKSNALRNTEEIQQVEKDDGLLLRALAEIVRECEKCYIEEYSY